MHITRTITTSTVPINNATVTTETYEVSPDFESLIRDLLKALIYKSNAEASSRGLG